MVKTRCAANTPTWSCARWLTSNTLRSIGTESPGYRTALYKHRQDNRLANLCLLDTCTLNNLARATGKGQLSLASFRVFGAAFVIQAFS
eukprot:6417435-Amphidinium_carterae.1